jgi:hypothetical protein
MPVRFEALLTFMGALLCSGLGIGVLYKKPHALVPRAFALGMLVLAIRETLLARLYPFIGICVTIDRQ